MNNLERLWKIREEEERERRHRHRLKELSDEHWERVRASGSISHWLLLAVGLLILIFFLRFAYGYIQALKTSHDAVQTPATQGHPPQDATRRSRAQEAPARK